MTCDQDHETSASLSQEGNPGGPGPGPTPVPHTMLSHHIHIITCTTPGHS